MQNLDRLRELWNRKPFTMPVGLLQSLDGFDFRPNENKAMLELQEKYESDRVVILSLAETRLMDLLPPFWGVARGTTEWSVWNSDSKILHSHPDRLSALIAWAESDACKETQ